MDIRGGYTLRAIAALVCFFALTVTALADADFVLPLKTYYRTASVQGHTIFYREAGDPSKPTLVLLHGFPTSSHAYRELIPMLSRYMHIIAPDNLGSGFSERPDPDSYQYSFDKLTDHVQGLLEALHIDRYALYMHDFGAPVGFRLIERHPERVQAIIVQNANAYLEGIAESRRISFRQVHDDRSPERVASVYAFVSREGVIDRQYKRDVPVERRDILSPDSWIHDLSFLQTDKDKKIQVELLQDYQTNIDQYEKWQETMRKHQFPTLIVWGERDPVFIAAGAKAYLRDLPNAELHLIDAGHFAVEERTAEIAQYILQFASKRQFFKSE
jgi:pimeloyl-ACP methyl ester carboxylesterase